MTPTKKAPCRRQSKSAAARRKTAKAPAAGQAAGRKAAASVKATRPRRRRRRAQWPTKTTAEEDRGQSSRRRSPAEVAKAPAKATKRRRPRPPRSRRTPGPATSRPAGPPEADDRPVRQGRQVPRGAAERSCSERAIYEGQAADLQGRGRLARPRARAGRRPVRRGVRRGRHGHRRPGAGPRPLGPGRSPRSRRSTTRSRRIAREDLRRRASAATSRSPKPRLRALPVRPAVRRLQERGPVAALSRPGRPVAGIARPRAAAAARWPRWSSRPARPSRWAVRRLSTGPVHVVGPFGFDARLQLRLGVQPLHADDPVGDRGRGDRARRRARRAGLAGAEPPAGRGRRSHPRRGARQPGRPGLPGPSRRRRRLRHALTTGRRSTSPTRASSSGCVLLVVSLLRGPPARDAGHRMIVTVPASLDGVRVDRAVALLADVSRAAVAELVADGRVAVDGRAGRHAGARPSSPAGRWPSTVRDEDRRPASSPNRTSRCTSSTPTTRSSSSTSPPASWSTRAPAHRTGRSSTGCWPASPSSRRRGGRPARSAPGSSTGSTAGRRACWWSPGPVAPTGRWSPSSAERTVERRYVALVPGDVDDDRGVVDAPIGRSSRTPTRMAVSARAGRPGPATGCSAGSTSRPDRRRRCSRSRSRPAAPTRSGSTWRPSATRWSATTGLRPAGRAGGLASPAGRLLPPRRRSSRFDAPGERSSRVVWTSPLPADLGRAHRRRSSVERPGRLVRRPRGAPTTVVVGQQRGERLLLGLADLADADAEPLGRRLERRRRVAVEAEPQPDHVALEVGQPVDGLAHPVEAPSPRRPRPTQSSASVATRSPSDVAESAVAGWSRLATTRATPSSDGPLVGGRCWWPRRAPRRSAAARAGR